MTTKLGALAPGADAIGDLIGLLRAWLARETPALPRTPVLALMEAAQVHGVARPAAEALSGALPGPAARALLGPVLAETDGRAARAFATLTSAAGTVRAAGIAPVALKGAAAMAATGGPAPWRGMVDVDLLVPRARMADALRALRDAGWRADDGAVYLATWDCYAHPSLIAPGRTVALELHSRCSYEHRGVLRGLGGRAVPSAVPGLLMPAPDDRLAHLVHQSQLMDRGWPRRVARLRDALDWAMILRAGGADPLRVEARFAAAGRGPAFRAFAVLVGRILDREAPAAWVRAHSRWADEALGAMADPARLDPFLRADRRGVILDALRSPGMASEYLSRLMVKPHREDLLPRLPRLIGRALGGRAH